MIFSLLFGAEGVYQLPGNIQVSFESKSFSDYFDNYSYFKPLSSSLRCRPLQIAALGYLHVWVHEMGHALAGKSIGGKSTAIYIDTVTCAGEARIRGNNDSILVSVGGPLAGMAFRIGVIALSHLATGTIPLAVLTATRILSLAWMSGEMTYLLLGATGGAGDWKKIKEKGIVPLTLCTTAMVITYVAGIALALNGLPTSSLVSLPRALLAEYGLSG